MTDIPQAAIDAAIKALTETSLLNNAGYISGDEHRAAEAALVAAAPHLAAAEREKLATWLQGPEALAITAGAVRAQVGQEIATAVAAERKRCIQLTEQHAAKPGYGVSFADLLREQP